MVGFPAMTRNPYSAAMTKRLFWFQEFKAVAALLNQGQSMAEIKAQNAKENLLGARSPYRGRTILNAVAARIASLPPEFLPFVERTDLPAQKLICLIAILCHDSLFFDFMYEVYREKLITGAMVISPADTAEFLRNKQAQNERVALWTDNTFNRVARAYKGILLNAGILNTTKIKTEWIIVKPILNNGLVGLLKKHGMGVFIAVFTGGSVQ
jgi:hypothetical protein